MATTLRFVESDLSTLRLALNWIEGQSDLSLPDHDKQWTTSPFADGQKYVSGHWTGRTLKLALSITGTSIADRNSDTRALITELTRENYLEYDDGANPMWIKTYPMDRAQITGLLERWFESAYKFHPIVIDLPADPFWFGPWQTLSIVHNKMEELSGRWSFEGVTSGPPNTDFTRWTETRTNGSGTATVEAYTSAKVFGAYGCQLKTTSADGVAAVESGAICVLDAGEVAPHHHNILFSHRRSSGADSLKCIIKQYDGANYLAGEDIIITPAGTSASERLSSTVIGPPGTLPNPVFHADCTDIHVRFEVSGAAAEWWIDCVVLVDSRYLAGHELTNPLAVVVPPSSLYGDVPAPYDIYLDAPDADVANTQIYLGGRQNYSAAFAARIENTEGSAQLGHMASRGDWRLQTVSAELLGNASFDLISGTAGSNSETWSNWTATRSAQGKLIAQSGGPPKDGAYCVQATPLAYTGSLEGGEHLSDFININIALDYLASIWYVTVLDQGSPGDTWIDFTVKCYTAAGAYLGEIVILSTGAEKSPWTFVSRTILAAEWPATTAKIKLWVRGRGRYPYDNRVFWDLAHFAQASSDVSARFSEYSDAVKGEVFPFLHCAITTSVTDKTLCLQAKLEDSILGDITSLQEQETITPGFVSGIWAYQKFSRLRLPTAAIADSADTATLKQDVEILFDPSFGAISVYIDDLTLLPIDNGYCKVPSGENRHLIIDSNSAVPAVLVSLDGTLDTAVQHSQPGALGKIFTLDPQAGLNMAILVILDELGYGATGQFYYDVTIKYRPRYLAVK